MVFRLSRRARSQLLLLAVVAVGAGWIGCATSNGDPVEEPGPLPTGSGTTKPEPTSRPDFEAGFVETDAGNTDPTPDGGDTCVDNGDPGSSENTATKLNDTDDAQNTPITVKGVLNGPVDIDVYKFSMTDGTGRSIDTDFQIKTSGVQMCVFVKCKSGPTTVSGCTGGVKTTAPGTGTEGCCANGPSTASPNWDCTGFTDNDSADFIVQLKQTADKCTNYSWSYVF